MADSVTDMVMTVAAMLWLLVPALSGGGVFQDTRPLIESADTHYYDFWIGRWGEVKDGAVGSVLFTVTRGVHPGALEEAWSGTLNARAFRAWDKTNNRWMHVWISSNGLFQVWEGRKVGDDWYMFKEFDVDGDRYLSRQAILRQGERDAVRVSERSDDGGKTWTLRFRQQLRRVNE